MYIYKKNVKGILKRTDKFIRVTDGQWRQLQKNGYITIAEIVKNKMSCEIQVDRKEFKTHTKHFVAVYLDSPHNIVGVQETVEGGKYAKTI